MEHLSAAAFAQTLRARESARLVFEPARSGVLSWNTHAPQRSRCSFACCARASPPATGSITRNGSPSGAKSFSPEHDGVRVDVDVIRAAQPFDGIEVRARDVRVRAGRVLVAGACAAVAPLRAATR